ncbi:FAD-binding protein [Sphingosinicella sp. BN140058]|nr:FAD-binding protein [Sphingosinicella sp. BN140058]
MPFDTDVLICGAGAAGLTLAIDLARRGLCFRLVEQNETPFGGSRGKGIQPRTLEVFEDLGLLDRIAAAGGPYPPHRIYRADGGIAEMPMSEPTPSSPAEPYREPLMVPQFMTEQVMRERLAELGHRPSFGVRLAHFEQDGDGVSATLVETAGERRIRARYLVGADGGRSFVRRALQVPFPGDTLGVRALVADVRLDGLDRTAWHRFQVGTGAEQVMICPLAGTQLFQIQAPVAPEGEVDVDVSPEGLNAMLARRTGRSDIRVHAVHWASVYSMNARLADHYRVGRVFLAGDAAHIHPPTGGQGLNTSIQDSYNLGWKLAATLGGAADTLLETYEEERRPIAKDVLGLATKLLDEAKQGMMRRAREVRQLDLGYRGSSLSLPGPATASGLQAGDRAPDAPCRGRAGQPARLFSLLQGTQWTLLGHAAAAQPTPRKNMRILRIGHDLLDDGGHIAEAYGLAAGQWALIRPDGYLAAIVVTPDLERAVSILPGAPSM